MEIDEPPQPERTPFSDFLLRTTKQYFADLQLPPDLQEKIINQETIILPVGSMNRGNADPLESDIDIVFITKNALRGAIPMITEGEFHPAKRNLEEIALEELKAANPQVGNQRKDIPCDNPVFTQQQLISAIAKQNLAREGQGGFPVAHIITLLLHTPESLMIFPNGVDANVFKSLRDRLNHAIDNLPPDEKQKVLDELESQYKKFKETVKTRCEETY